MRIDWGIFMVTGSRNSIYQNPSSLIWFYVIVSALWIIGTGMLNDHSVHHLITRDVAASFIRNGTLFAFSVWLIKRFNLRTIHAKNRYETLVQTSPQPLFVYSNEVWVYVNPAGLKLVGAKQPEDVIGHPIWDIIHPDDRPAVLEQTENLYHDQSSMAVYADRRIIRLDGQVLEVELTATPVKFDGESAIQVLYIDVSERKKAERDRDSAVSHLRVFMELNPEAIMILNNEGRFITANSKFEELFLVNRDDLRGKYWWDTPLIPLDKVNESRRFVERVTRGKLITGHRLVRQTTLGNEVDVSLAAFQLHDDALAVVIHDITKERQAEEQLLQSEKLAAIGQLAAGIAHEIRNPLTTVSGLLSILSTASSEKQSEYISVMSGELMRISGIVTDMLALAKPQPDEFRPMNIGKLVEDVYHLMHAEVLMHGAQFSLQVSESIGTAIISGQEHRLKQVVINLVKNAIDALADAPHKSISINAERNADTDSVLIIIEDTGIGITEQQLQRLFDPFYTTKAHGTGLGLHICNQIVTHHQGNLRFDSELGIGTTVTVTLPALVE